MNSTFAEKMSLTENIFLGLGSNKDDRLSWLKEAVRRISSDTDTVLTAVSSVYESEPYGVKEQENFLNAAIRISSRRSLHELHAWIKNLEKEIGRQEGPRWGPREIDIDLLFYGNTVLSSQRLTVPHKEIALRDFVLLPLKEIAPDFIHPVLNIPLKDIPEGSVEKLVFIKHNFILP